MNVETILRAKGREVATIRPDQTVGDAVAELISRNIGALVVSEDGDSVDGIISERDIVHAVADRDASCPVLDPKRTYYPTDAVGPANAQHGAASRDTARWEQSDESGAAAPHVIFLVTFGGS